MSPEELTQSLKAESKRLGFQLSGACQTISPAGFDHFSSWLDAGYAGEMHYLSERQDAYRDPNLVLDGVESLLMLGMSYHTQDAELPSLGQGRISKYAWGGGDYHDLIHKRLKQLCRFARELPSENAKPIEVRGIIDTAPLLEREFAALAGLGWQAKNTMLISRDSGSYFFLAALLINQKLEYDSPITTNHCGSCTACLDACPTDAFVKPHVLDATKCISYLTIEHRTDIPESLRKGMADWVFGCDVCQEVCPWNRFATESDEPLFQPAESQNPLDLIPLFDLDDDAFRLRFRKTPMWRSKRRGMLRNAAIALGNQQSSDALPALRKGLQDQEPLIQEACQWAIGQIESA
jgi:epoxyqueuosine reductase